MPYWVSHSHLHFAEDTPVPAIEDAFKRFTEREDIAIVLINQYVRYPSAGGLPSPDSVARAFFFQDGGRCGVLVASTVLDGYPYSTDADGPSRVSLRLFSLFGALFFASAAVHALVCRYAWPACVCPSICAWSPWVIYACCPILDVGCLQQIANEIRPVLAKFSAPVPAVLEIPSKEHPYDASKDSILQRVRNMLGTS